MEQIPRHTILWVEIEKSGNDYQNDKMFELAIMASDGELNCFVRGPTIVFHHSLNYLETLPPKT